MSDEIITPENVSKEILKSLFDSAFMETSFDSEGDLRVKDDISCWVLPSANKERINLISNFSFTENSTRLERLEAANKLNTDWAIITAIVGLNDNLRFSYDIFIGGGVTGKDIVLATKRFLAIPRPAIAQDAIDVVL